MKACFRSVFIRAVFVVVAVVAAYMVGLSQKIAAGDEDTVPGNLGKRNPVGAHIAAAPQNSVLLDQMRASVRQDMDFTELLGKDPKLGVAELARLPLGASTQDTYNRSFGAWVGEHPELAPDIAATAYALPLGVNRTAALNGAIAMWSRLDPQSLVDWAGSLAPTDSEPLKDALISISNNEHNPALAAQYVDDFQDAAARNQTIQAIARTWALGWMGNGSNSDPAAALDWLDQVATGVTYDNNVNYILNNLAQHDPAMTAGLLEKITEPGVRATAITSLANAWARNDPQATVEWLRGLSDSDGAYDSLTQKLAQIQTAPK